MSILIKNMEMPKNCGECPFTDSIWCGRTGQRIYSTMLDRLPDCPLIEVAKHGRLIDADALLDSLNVFSDRINGDEHFLNGIDTAKELAVDAPTIIEAEGEDD